MGISPWKYVLQIDKQDYKSIYVMYFHWSSLANWKLLYFKNTTSWTNIAKCCEYKGSFIEKASLSVEQLNQRNMYVPLLIIVFGEYQFSTISISKFNYINTIFGFYFNGILSVMTITSAQYTDPLCPTEEEPRCAVRCNLEVDSPICVLPSDGIEITLRNRCVFYSHNCNCPSWRKSNFGSDGFVQLVELNFNLF